MTRSAGSSCAPRAPGSNGPGAFRPGILLDEMAARHGHFRLIAPAAAELALVSDQNGAGIGIDELFRDVVLSHPTGIGGTQLGNRGGLPVDRDLARPGQGRPAILPRARKGMPVFFISAGPRRRKIEAGRTRSTNMFLSRTIPSPASERNPWNIRREPSSHSVQASGRTIASM